MRVGHETPNIIRFTYRQEQGDPDCGRCGWADFDFDTVNYNLSISSDCGYYGYGWNPTESESFLELMARIHDDYLLRKLCRESTVDWEKTKDRLAEVAGDMGLSPRRIKSGIRALEDLAEEYDLTEDIGFTTRLIEEWNEDYFEIPDVWEYVYTDYTGDQKHIAQVFTDYIQPAIREYLKEQEAGNEDVG